MELNNFFGSKNTVFWIGKIVNRADPLALGRCQVRIFGYHTDNKAMLPDEDLPWALALYPINASNTFSKPRINDWVLGLFLDGESAQTPLMLGVISGLTESTT
jgi:hypothetical protein